MLESEDFVVIHSLLTPDVEGSLKTTPGESHVDCMISSLPKVKWLTISLIALPLQEKVNDGVFGDEDQRDC